MHCSQCGEEISIGDRFCVNCGAPAETSAEKVSDTASEKNSSLPGKQNNKFQAPAINTKRGKSGTKIGLIVLLAIILAAGGFWGWKSYGSPEVRAKNRLDIAIKYVSENNFEQAILAYNEAIKINPKETQAYQGLAKVYSLQGNYENAQGTYDQGIKAVKADEQIKLELGLAALFIDKKDYAEAITRFQQLINKDRTNIDAYRGLALVYQTQNKLDQAKAVLEQCIRANPNDYRAYNARADIEEYYTAAHPYVAKSLELEMNQQEVYSILTRIYNPKNSNSDFWVAALSKPSISPTAVPMLRFYAYYRDGKFDKALAEYHSNMESSPTNLKARALASICMVKTGDNAGAAKVIAEVEKSKLYDVVQIDVAYYYSLINQTDKAKSVADKVLNVASPDLGAIQIAAQILGSDSPNVQIAAAKYVAQQWIPVAKAVKDLGRVEVKTSISIPTTDPLDFIKINYPDIQNLENYSITKMELTGDNIAETILTGYPNAFVLKTKGNSYQVLYKNDLGRYGFDQPAADQYQNLYISSHSGGTGIKLWTTTILRWDGSQLREVWSGDTKNFNDLLLKGTQLVDENATVKITGTNQPEKLTYIKTGMYGHYGDNGQQVWDKSETVTKEYTFDTAQFKFIESTSKTETNGPTADQNAAYTGSANGDQRLAVLKAAQADIASRGGNVVLEPPYGNPKARDGVVCLKELNGDTALIACGEWQTGDASLLVYKRNSAGKWVFYKDATPDY